MVKGDRVTRPTRTTEYTIVFGSREAQQGWQSLLATQQNALALAWDQLSHDPFAVTAKIHPLKGQLAQVTRAGHTFEQRQCELSGGARLWFYVHERRVVLVNVHIRHPNQTK